MAIGVGRLVSSAAIPVGRLTPGAMLAGRYRIIGLLGRGGMGEVYRADDVKLGQPVALKFLPKALSDDPVRRERFFAEVRITRQLAHPNICRVYDIAEADGQHFLSMEYIDGEDLASLLKRIGYLADEKALDITRQLLAGLAAAHERGVLHRDLKPSNIMLDGRGRVRIADFGLAVGVTDETPAGDVSGTPAYMAPEQLAGKGATVRSDIYAIGLILYEVLSGKKAFTAPTLAELRAVKEQSTPTAPSELRANIDPAVERLVMRCLERDPRARPPSVAQLAAALPGGDPLAAAIAAGETPSPELLIASGPSGGLRPLVAVALLGVVIAGTFVAVALNDRVGLVPRTGLLKPPDAMAERARAILKRAGFPEESNDRAFGFYADDDVLQYVAKEAANRSRDLNALGAVKFFYRQSPRSIVSMNPTSGVDPGDPPLGPPGDVEIRLDSDGRLRALQAVPSFTAVASATSPQPGWAGLFDEAGLDLARWTPVEPASIPSAYADTRVAWTGSLPDEAVPARIEAAAYRGRPVKFDISGPWTTSSSVSRSGPPLITDGAPLALAALAVTFIGGGLFFARQNLRSGRGDRRGATRLMLAVLAIWLTAWALIEHHVADAGEGLLFYYAFGVFLSAVALLWVFYVALEPFVRRRWPHMLVSWTRLLSGDWRDPLIGRDVLIGCASGATIACLPKGALLINLVLQTRADVLGQPDWNLFNGTAAFAGGLLGHVASSIFFGLAFLFLFFVFRVLLRRDWAAAAALFLVFCFPAFGQSWQSLPLTAAFALLNTLVLTRVGLVAAIAQNFFTLFVREPMTLHTSAWYASAGYVCFVVIAAITFYGFKTSLGGQRLMELRAD